MTRLEILQNSLAKKKAEFDLKLQHHFDTVKQANGQPLNDKRCGASTVRKWDKQSDALRTLEESIKKTENAINIEEGKMKDVEASKDEVPEIFFKLVEEGKLTQWRKYPNRFFVVGVEKARFIWDNKKKGLFTKFTKSIPNEEQATIFRSVCKDILEGLK